MTRVLLLLLFVAAASTGALAQLPAPPPWAYTVNPPPVPGARPAPPDPAPQLVPGSSVSLTVAQTRDAFNPPDWHPSAHPPMPESVAHGRRPEMRACGFCHLVNGQGRPENASLAGLPAAYIVQQMADFKNGDRKSAEPRMGPPNAMIQDAKAATDEEVRTAAAYFASFPFKKWISVTEADEVPKTRIAGSMHVPTGEGSEPLGQRIIEMPSDLRRTELRDASSGFVAYVPKGSIAGSAQRLSTWRIIRSRIRKEDTAARIGLAHFAISLPTGKPDGSKGLADRIRTEIASNPLNLGGKPVRLAASGGVLTPESHPGLTAVSVMEECQQVLEAAIKAGGNCVLGDVDIRKIRADVLLPSRPVPPQKTELQIGQVRIDDLLGQIEKGNTQSVVEQLPQTLKRLLPLLRLMNERQRQQLIQFLQKLAEQG